MAMMQNREKILICIIIIFAGLMFCRAFFETEAYDLKESDKKELESLGYDWEELQSGVIPDTWRRITRGENYYTDEQVREAWERMERGDDTPIGQSPKILNPLAMPSILLAIFDIINVILILLIGAITITYILDALPFTGG